MAESALGMCNPPPTSCDGCRQIDGAWILVRGERELELSDGRKALRRGRVYVCQDCGYTVPISSEVYQ